MTAFVCCFLAHTQGKLKISHFFLGGGTRIGHSFSAELVPDLAC